MVGHKILDLGIMVRFHGGQPTFTRRDEKYYEAGKTMALREDIEKQGNWLFRWRSYLPLLFMPILFMGLRDARISEKTSDFWGTCAIILAFGGLLVRCAVAGYVSRGTSGRNTKWQAAEILNTTGMYSIVRNPLYLGNLIIVFGIVLFIQVWWLVLVMVPGFLAYYERIIFAEEEFLRKKFGVSFLEWAEKTPAMIPRFKNWKKPDLPFSFKTAIRREFSTYFSIVTALFFLEVAANLLAKKHFSIRGSWIIFFLTGLVVYWTLVFLKKKTKILNVPGR